MTIHETFFIIKPDGMPFKSDILFRLSSLGQLRDLNEIQASEEVLKKHYAHLADKPFFPRMIELMQTDKVLIGKLASHKDTIVEELRELVGATNPEVAKEGTLRRQYGLVLDDDMYNVIHASDSLDTAKREITLWYN